jgi:rod shape-determining protein MreD
MLMVIALVQTTIMPHIGVWGVFPNLPLLVVISWSLLRGAREGLIWGFIAGVAVDLFSGAPFGAATFSLILVGLLSGLAGVTVFRTHAALPLLTAFLATIIYGLCFLLIVRVSGYTVVWIESLLRIILPAAVLNTVLVPLVLLLLRFVHTRFGREGMEW